MEKTLTAVCEYLNNYFWRSKIVGSFTIENGTLEVPTLKSGQYFRVIGSLLNDGVYRYPATGLIDEDFNGAIWSMAVPPAVIDLVSDIEEWQEKYGGIDSENMSPFNSESFGGYSYSKSSSSGSMGSGNTNSWQGVFASRLAPYRRLRNMP